MPSIPQTIQQSAKGVDLSPRVVNSTTVVASPTGSAEIVIASLQLPTDLAYSVGVTLLGFAALTLSAGTTSARLRVRQTGLTGATVADTGAVSGGITAAALAAPLVFGQDTSPPAGGAYVLTATLGGASTASTASAVSLFGIAV